MNTRVAAAFAALAVLLVATSDVRVVGDGHEYLAMSLGILAHGSPSPRPQQLDELETRLAQHGVPLLRDALHEGRDGRLHFRHFWVYPALATPAVAAATLFGAHPAWGFTLLNLALLSLAAGVLARRAGALFTLLLFAGPIIWWIDKAHPEAFVFALLLAGFTLLRDRPGAALIAWGLAAAQYPPLALLLVLGVVESLWSAPQLRADRRFLTAAGAAFLLAALQPAHSLWKLGVISPLVFWGRAPALPSWRAWSAVYADLNIGLLVGFPFLPLVVIVVGLGLSRAEWRALAAREAAGIALAAGLLLPFAFAQTVNVNHGGTPGMSRYALWLIPLTVPLLIAAADRRPAPRRIVLTVAASVLWCLVYYHPRHAEQYQQPTWTAATVWRYAPRLSTPLPEVFAERLTHHEPGLLSVATPSCSKILLREGRWPAPCSPVADAPTECRAPGALCWANRRSGHPNDYLFHPIDDPVPAAYQDNLAVWPEEIQPLVARLLDDLRWWEMASEAGSDAGVLRAAQGAGWTTWLLGEDRFFLYASAPRAGGSVTLRLPRPMSGVIVAMADGGVVRRVDSPPGAGALWNVELPAVGAPGVALVLRGEGSASPR